jgi:hypothetical protein
VFTGTIGSPHEEQGGGPRRCRARVLAGVALRVARHDHLSGLSRVLPPSWDHLVRRGRGPFRSITEPSAAWLSRSSTVSQEGRQASGALCFASGEKRFGSAIRRGLPEQVPTSRFGIDRKPHSSQPAAATRRAAPAPRRSLHGPCVPRVCPRTSSPASSAHDARAKSA